MTRQFFAALIVAVAAPALMMPTTARAEFYAGFGVGGARVEADTAELGILPIGPGTEQEVAADRAAVGSDFSGSDIATQFVVGWRARYIGVEAAYVNFNQMGRSEAERFYNLPDRQLSDPESPVPVAVDRQWRAGYAADGYQASVVGFLPLSAGFELLARVGAITWESEQTGNERISNLVPTYEGNEPVSAKDDGTDLTVGIGAIFNTDSPFSVRVQADYYDLGNTDEVMMYTVSAFYSFGKRASAD